MKATAQATATIILPRRHPGQQRVGREQARFTVLACGRRWGKTRYGALRCIEVGLAGGRAWWVAPTFGMAAVGWRLLKTLAQQLPNTVIRETDKRITFVNGGWVQVKSADDPNALRGEGLDFVVLDECAFMQPSAWHAALRPALADRVGEALFISTPNGRNWFWQLFQMGVDPAEREWASFQLPTADNPIIGEGEIEAARRSLPEAVFRQEFLAEFLADGQGVFRNFSRCATASPQVQAEAGHRYVMGVDWGRSIDFTAIAVLDVTTRSLVHLERFSQVPYVVQLQRLSALSEKFAPSLILAERNSMGDPLIEQLVREGLPVQGFTTTAASKARVIEGLALAFEREDVQILSDPVLLGELGAYAMQRGSMGALHYGAPAGGHDDTVMALALGWYALSLPHNLPAFVIPF